MLSFYFPPLAHPLSKFWHSTCRKLEDLQFVGHSTHRFKHLLLLLWVAFLIKSCFYSTQIMILFTNFRSNLIVVISIPISIADSHSIDQIIHDLVVFDFIKDYLAAVVSNSYSDYNLGFNLHDKHLKFFHHVHRYYRFLISFHYQKNILQIPLFLTIFCYISVTILASYYLYFSPSCLFCFFFSLFFLQNTNFLPSIYDSCYFVFSLSFFSIHQSHLIFHYFILLNFYHRHHHLLHRLQYRPFLSLTIDLELNGSFCNPHPLCILHQHKYGSSSSCHASSCILILFGKDDRDRSYHHYIQVQDRSAAAHIPHHH